MGKEKKCIIQKSGSSVLLNILIIVHFFNFFLVFLAIKRGIIIDNAIEY